MKIIKFNDFQNENAQSMMDIDTSVTKGDNKMVTKAWQLLAKLPKDKVVNDPKLGLCFPAHSVLQALKIVGGSY